MSAASNPDSVTADVAETHVSVIFFAGDRAYKLLKPITTPYLDYGSSERRLAAAVQELQLNRRLAPDVYLGTADIVENDEVVDRMIVMRRMPAERRLSRLLWSPETDDIIRSVARAVATFHAAAPPLTDTGGDNDVDSIAGVDAVRANWLDNHAELERHRGGLFDADVHDRIVELADRYLNHHHDLFAQRISDGFVREGHGDLTAEDIFALDDGPRILDCLAFDRNLRIADVLADISFLAMDLDRLAGPALARKLMGWYSEYSNEHHPSSLAHHYVAYRAHVRAKVEALRHDQGDAAAGDRARRYFSLALDHLERAQLKLVLVGGAPGTGKSTLSDSLSGELGFAVLDSDTLRKDLTGKGHNERDDSPLDQGSHSAEWDDATYDALIERGGLLLDRGESVILDASWSDAERRQTARDAAKRHGAELIEIECVLDADVAAQRVAERRAQGHGPSDARPALLTELRDRRAPWPEATQIEPSGTREQATTDALTIVEGHRFQAGNRTL